MELRKRHGCVTAWLILMIILNSLVAILYLFGSEIVYKNSTSNISETGVLILGIIATGNLIFSVMLLKWKKWAFWGFTATSVITLSINVTNGHGVGTSLIGLIGVVVLYGILQIKKDEVSAWDNLE